MPFSCTIRSSSIKIGCSYIGGFHSVDADIHLWCCYAKRSNNATIVQSKQNETMNTNFLNAKKFLLKFTLLACLASPLISCSNDDDNNAPAYASQNPLAGYLEAANFSKITEFKNSSDFEFGISFIPTINGKITAITAKIPDVHSDMRITIWDKASKTVLRTELIDVMSSGVEITKEISAFAVEKNKEYMFTFNSNDWYEHRATDNADAAYPLTVGDIKITGYGFVSGTAQTIPNILPNNYYAGDISFKFQKD